MVIWDVEEDFFLSLYLLFIMWSNFEFGNNMNFEVSPDYVVF